MNSAEDPIEALPSRDAQLRYRTLIDLVRLFHRAREIINKGAREQVRLTAEQVSALCLLDLEGGSATVSRVAAGLGRANHSVSALADNLEKLGLVVRQRGSNGQDRRTVQLQLTPQGAQRLQTFRAFLDSKFAQQLVNPPLPGGDPAPTAGEVRIMVKAIEQFLDSLSDP